MLTRGNLKHGTTIELLAHTRSGLVQFTIDVDGNCYNQEPENGNWKNAPVMVSLDVTTLTGISPSAAAEVLHARKVNNLFEVPLARLVELQGRIPTSF